MYTDQQRTMVTMECVMQNDQTTSRRCVGPAPRLAGVLSAEQLQVSARGLEAGSPGAHLPGVHPYKFSVHDSHG